MRIHFGRIFISIYKSVRHFIAYNNEKYLFLMRIDEK